jgi:large conductance mechanosensitive channel
MGMLKEFREFAMRGNVVDMAVGIVIGTAFGKIVSSLVGDVIMPLVGKLTGSGSFKDQFIWLSDQTRPDTLDAAIKSGEPLIGWGSFLQSVIDFTIIAFAIFLVIKAMNAAKARFERKEAAAPAAPPEEILLLRDIRDQLAKR